MVVDEKAGLLKIIDLGSSFGLSNSQRKYGITTTLYGKVREYTPEYSPPEVLKFAKEIPSLDQYNPGSLDVYSWAMTFYTLLFP
jgi:hypothetical protein